jgi:NADH-quinone oxidoreductase subunit G
MRLKPRFNKAVNQWWICDEGRYSYKFIDDPSRLVEPQIRKGNGFEALHWNEVIREVVSHLLEAKKVAGPNSVVVIASPQLTNEDLFSMRKFFGFDLGMGQIDFRIPDHHPAAGDFFLLRADRNPNTRGAEAILMEEGGFSLPQLFESSANQRFKLLYICEQDLMTKLGQEHARRFIDQFEFVIYQGSNENETSRLANVVLPAATYAEVEGTFTNFEGRVQKINPAVEPLGESLPPWQIMNKLAKASGFDYSYESAEEVFEELAQSVVEFDSLTYQKIGDQGVTIINPATVQA